MSEAIRLRQRDLGTVLAWIRETEGEVSKRIGSMAATQDFKCIAIIPARGRSKGIPGKNLRLLAGCPLIVHSIIAAHAARDVKRVYVSTDDVKIMTVARQWGADIIERPAELATDTCSSESALRHALATLARGRQPDAVVFLQATSPLRRPGDVQRAIEDFRRERADSLFSACLAQGFVWRDGTHGPRPLNYDPARRPRRQEAPEDLIENGSIYIFKPWVLERFNSRLGGKVSVYRMGLQESFQIDEPEDLALLEILMVRRRSSEANGRSEVSPPPLIPPPA